MILLRYSFTSKIYCFHVRESLNFLAFYDNGFKDFFINSLKMQEKVLKEL